MGTRDTSSHRHHRSPPHQTVYKYIGNLYNPKCLSSSFFFFFQELGSESGELFSRRIVLLSLFYNATGILLLSNYCFFSSVETPKNAGYWLGKQLRNPEMKQISLCIVSCYPPPPWLSLVNLSSKVE